MKVPPWPHTPADLEKLQKPACRGSRPGTEGNRPGPTPSGAGRHGHRRDAHPANRSLDATVPRAEARPSRARRTVATSWHTKQRKVLDRPIRSSRARVRISCRSGRSLRVLMFGRSGGPGLQRLAETVERPARTGWGKALARREEEHERSAKECSGSGGRGRGHGPHGLVGQCRPCPLQGGRSHFHRRGPDPVGRRPVAGLDNEDVEITHRRDTERDVHEPGRQPGPGSEPQPGHPEWNRVHPGQRDQERQLGVRCDHRGTCAADGSRGGGAAQPAKRVCCLSLPRIGGARVVGGRQNGYFRQDGRNTHYNAEEAGLLIPPRDAAPATPSAGAVVVRQRSRRPSRRRIPPEGSLRVDDDATPASTPGVRSSQNGYNGQQGRRNLCLEENR